MNDSPGARFLKIGKLITVLKKSNGKAVVGSSEALVSPKAAKIIIVCCFALLVAALSAGMYFIEPAIGKFIDAENLSKTLMLAFFIMSFVLAVKDVVSVLYMADDLELLLPMPFSATQIVISKLVVASSLPVTISIIGLNSACLGFGIREGAGALYIIGILVSSVLMPVTGIALATFLVVLFFRLFGFIRNRDLTVALGGLFTFGITIAYIIVSNSLGQKNSEEVVASLKVISSASSVFPHISFMNRFMFDKFFAGIFISLAVSAAVILLAVFAVKLFYLSTALSMQNTASNKKAVTAELLRVIGKNGTQKALTLYEAKSTKRNPAYLIYGFVMSFVWPVIFALPFIFGSNTLSKVTLPLGSSSTMLAVLSLALTASCFSCGYNILAGTAFSREGSTFAAIRALPVEPKDYYKSKRNFALFICSLGSALYVVLTGIVCMIAGVIPVSSVWTVPAGAFCSVMLNLLIVNLILLKHSRNPRLNWDSETEFSRKLGIINVAVIVAGVIALVVCLGSVTFSAQIEESDITGAVMIAFAAVFVTVTGASLLFNAYAVKTGAGNLMKVDV